MTDTLDIKAARRYILPALEPGTAATVLRMALAELEAARSEITWWDTVWIEYENMLAGKDKRIAELEDQTANENYCVNYCGVNEQLRKRIAELEVFERAIAEQQGKNKKPILGPFPGCDMKDL